MIRRLSTYIYSIFALFILFNCTANAATTVSSDIYIDQTWELSGSPYIVTKSITLEANLTIKPGVVVRFARGVDFIVKGKVSAVGTESSKITFMADTSVLVRPYWGAIKINYNGQSDISKFIYCEFQSGGYGYVPPLIINTQTSPYLRNLSFSNNFYNGITFGFSDFTASTIMYNCGAPYILMMSKSVNEKATLSIEAGTVIKSLQRVVLDIRGDMVANGTHQSPITFTALKDDDIDGVDADGVGYTVPNSGDWGGLYYYSSINSNKSILKNVRIRYGGGSDATLQSNIVLKGANLRIEYCKFEKSTKTGISCLDYASPDLGGGALRSVGFNMFDGFEAPGYAIANYGYSTIYALNNCWGATDSAAIARQFFTKTSGVMFYPFNIDCKLNSPDAPTLVYPANYEKGIAKNFTFMWNSVPAANDYQFQMAIDKQFTSIYLSKTQIDTFLTISGLKYNTDYYWRVKAANLAGESEWSDCFTFRVMDSVKPAIPEPISPIAMKFSNCNTDFSWKKVNNADKYHIQISQTQDFSKCEIDDSTLTLNSTNYSTLTRSKMYYWRVRSSNIKGKSEWSDVKWFITDDLLAAKTILKINGKASNFKSVDLNGNGYQDIIYLKDSNSSKNLFVADNIGGFTFIERVLQPSTKATNFFFVDLNNDNLLDIIIEENYNNKYVYSTYQYINEKLTLLEPNFLSLDKPLRKVIGSDLDNDGKNEFAFLFGDDKKGIALFEFQANKLVQKLKLTDVAIADVASFDFNRDGYRDIAALQGDSLFVFFNKISTFIKKSIKLSSAADSLIVYDYNQDKYSDILTIGANGIQFFKNNGTDFIKEFSFIEKNLDLVSIFDLNNDSTLDLVYSISNTNRLIGKTIENIKNNNSLSDTLNENYSVLLYGAFDADNEYDFIAYNSNEKSLVALKNMSCKANTAVYPPINLRYVFSNGKIVFEWDKNPLNSPDKNITYSIAVGSDVVDYDVIVPGSDYNRLRMMNDNAGNCGYANFYITSGIPSGRYYWQVQSIDENGTASQFSSIDEVKSQDIASLPPLEWMKVPCTGKNSTIILPYLNNLMINGRRLRDGDALGVFYTKDSSLVCGGYGVWRDGRNMAFTVWGDDQSTKEKDGFDNSENYRFIFWDVVKQQTYPVAARYESGAPWFLPDTVTTIASFGRFDSLVVELKANTWNFVSSNVAPHNPSFDNFLPEQVKQVTDDEGNQKVPGQNDDLQYWDVLTAYNVYATEDTKLKIVGVKIKPEQAEIVIPNNKMTYITYLPDSAYSFTSAFANIYSSILICKDEMGRINMPDYSHIEFGTIYPTKGYKIMLKTSDTLIYPYYGNKANQTNVSAPTHFIPAYTRTGSDATIVMKFDKATDGDEVGVYSAYSRMLCGSGVIKNNHAYITVWGDNPLTDKVVEGAKENEELYAKYYSKKDNTEYYAPIEKAKLFVDNSLINVATYISDGAYIYESKKEMLTAISEDVEIPSSTIVAYPNPFQQSLTIEKNAEDYDANYSLIDSEGKIVGDVSTNSNTLVRFNTSKLAPGAYYIVFENKGKKDIKKVIKLK